MRRTVLVVDDHPAFRAEARAMFEASGFRVVGEPPTPPLLSRPSPGCDPGLVLLDVQLPETARFESSLRLGVAQLWP